MKVAPRPSDKLVNYRCTRSSTRTRSSSSRRLRRDLKLPTPSRWSHLAVPVWNQHTHSRLKSLCSRNTSTTVKDLSLPMRTSSIATTTPQELWPLRWQWNNKPSKVYSSNNRSSSRKKSKFSASSTISSSPRWSWPDKCHHPSPPRVSSRTTPNKAGTDKSFLTTLEYSKTTNSICTNYSEHITDPSNKIFENCK
jgi:hypothetical protein